MRKYTVASIVLCTTMMSGLAGADVVINNQNIPGVDIQAITVSPSSGDIFITTKVGYTVQKDGVEPPPPGSVVINNFTVSPNNLTAGGVVSLNWTTTNAVSCTASGATGPWQATAIAVPSGVRNLTMNNPNTYTFSLTCLGSTLGDTTTRSVTAIVNPVIPTSCPTAPLSGSVDEWKGFWLVDYPGPTYTNKYFGIPRFGYRALKFNTGSIVDNGSLTSIETTQTDGVRLGTITECPGDFSTEVPTACRKVWGLSGSLRWATDGRSGACQLEPNTDYYFNVTFTDGTDKNKSSCSITPCLTELQHNNF